MRLTTDYSKEAERKALNPSLGVLGVAGAVENNKVRLTNIPHWATLNGEEIRQELPYFEHFEFINDFAAAGL